MGFDHITAAANEPERIARLRLARTQRIGPVNFAQLMQRFGSAIRALEELPHVVRRTGGSLTPYPVAKLDEELARAEAAGNDILKLCVDHGGCLTGEHGVGMEKRDLMRHQYKEADLAQQMRLRAAFDPKWILNPSKVFPLEGRTAA